MPLNLNNLTKKAEEAVEKVETTVQENTPTFMKGNDRPEPPKMYDKDGNEVTGKPEDGVTYYDKDGNELKMPDGPKKPEGQGGPGFGKGPGGPGPMGHGGSGFGGPQGHHEPPKMYDKDGNEVTGKPEDGVTYYDKDGNELKKPDCSK